MNHRICAVASFCQVVVLDTDGGSTWPDFPCDHHYPSSIVEEAPYGRILVGYISEDDREHGLAYIYR